MFDSPDQKHNKEKSRLTSVKNTHQEVKAKILELLGTWSETFAKDPDLGIMEQAFIKLKSQSTTSRQTTRNSSAYH